jgi:hypothetical protein
MGEKMFSSYTAGASKTLLDVHLSTHAKEENRENWGECLLRIRSRHMRTQSPIEARAIMLIGWR